MHNERELIELAAIACGYEIARWSDDGAALLLKDIQYPWNPARDDGDNARMEAQLKMNVEWAPTFGLVYVGGHRERIADHDGDCQAARR